MVSRRDLLAAATTGYVSLSGCTGLGLSAAGDREWAGPRLTRFALTARGAEVTGLHLGPRESLFMNIQHPDTDNQRPFNFPGVGVFVEPLADLPDQFPSVQVPDEPSQTPRSAYSKYQLLAVGGQGTVNDEPLGIPLTPDGGPITNGFNPDMNVFIAESANEGYLFTNWESKPGMITRLHLRRDEPGATWDVLRAENLNMRAVDGTWRNCFGTRTPWGTPLSAEELYFPNTAKWNQKTAAKEDAEPTLNKGVQRMESFLGEFPNPYRYGYMVEVQEPTAEAPTLVKHWALGRFSHENALVMADERTVYMSDDGHGTGFFKFVADEPGDLSAGTLYAAKAQQDRGDAPSEVGFDISWVELAHATRTQVESWIAEYDDVGPEDSEEGSSSYISDAEIEAWARGEADDDRAAFLETRKAAKAAGATIEFNKMEGVNARRGAQPGDDIFLAMTGLTHTMADGEGDIQVKEEGYGAVYRLPIREGYDVDRMEPVVVGGPEGNVCGGCPYDAQPDSSDICDGCVYNPASEAEEPTKLGEENTLSNPDNLVILQDGRVIVGEDSKHHDNSMVWVYDPNAEEQGGEA